MSENTVDGVMDPTHSNIDASVTPIISIVSAVYNVEDYLQDFLDSLDRQSNRNSFEVILVLDGSLDSSEDMIRQWSSNTRVKHTVIKKANGGQASARNVGIKRAAGEWVTFCDPDDYLADDYIQQLLTFMGEDSSGNVVMYVTQVVTFDEKTGQISTSHPLNRRFRDGNRFVNLDRSPDFFHMSGATAVVRTHELRKLDHSFNERLTFSFEDAHFVSAYLLQQPTPVIGVVASSSYYYRRRAAGNSSVQTSALRPEKYGAVLEYGHLDLLELAKKRQGSVPMWLQMLIIYDLLWYFRGDRKVAAPSKRLSPEVLTRFHELVGKILQDIPEHSIHQFEVMPTDFDLKDALILGYKNASYRPRVVQVERIDVEQKMTLLHYVYSGELPEETIRFKGQHIVPKHAKTRPMVFLGKTLFSHRYLWIPATGTFSVSIDGEIRELALGMRKRPHYALRPFVVSKALAGMDVTRSVGAQQAARDLLPMHVRVTRRALGAYRKYEQKTAAKLKFNRDKNQRLLKRADKKEVRHKYSNAWILMDRIYRANDNAEHLYRYLKLNRPKVNAWFVLEKSSPDWERLADEGFRLLEHGSDEHKLALMNAQVYASSHLDKFVTDPLEGALKKRATWKFVFLQHGVTDHDLSFWFNTKQIDLLITSTHDEYKSIIGNDTSYRFTTKEVKLTGFPRHDALGEKPETARARWILVSPTWRQSLVGPPDIQGRRTKIEGFRTSEYALSWGNFLKDPRLVSFASENNLQIGLLPHPALVDYVPDMELGENVHVLDWDEKPFAEFVHESAVLVTDYSSTAFEAAYCGIPVVYFQFDQEDIKLGAHTYDGGYYDFEQDGFGPVTVEPAEAVSETISSVKGLAHARYKMRVEQTFGFLDSKNSERVYQEIKKLFRPAKYKEVIDRAESESN